MSKRIKTTGPLLRTRQDMEYCMGEIREITIQLNACKAERDARTKDVDDVFQPRLDRITELLGLQMESARAWAEANPEEFGKARSLETVHGKIGFRTGQPALKTLSGWTFERVLAALKAVNFTQFIRQKEEVDKQAMISARTNLTESDLRRFGVRVVQEESFFIEPNLQELPAVPVP